MVWLPDGEKNFKHMFIRLDMIHEREKIAVFTYRSSHYCLPWRRPSDYHAICCMDGKTIQCLPNHSQYVPIYLQQFPSYTMLKSKNRYFYHIFVSPGLAPGAITLSVVWLEREFDAYRLSRTLAFNVLNNQFKSHINAA